MMSSGYNSKTLAHPGRGAMVNSLAAPGIDEGLDFHPEDILRNTVDAE